MRENGKGKMTQGGSGTSNLVMQGCREAHDFCGRTPFLRKGVIGVFYSPNQTIKNLSGSLLPLSYFRILRRPDSCAAPGSASSRIDRKEHPDPGFRSERNFGPTRSHLEKDPDPAHT